MPAGFRKWVDDLIGVVKAWMLQRFGMQAGDVTPAQLRALAVAALKGMGDSARMQAPGNASAAAAGPRAPLPRAILGGDLGTLRRLPDFEAAKAGDIEVADRVAAATVSPSLISKLDGVAADVVIGVLSDEATGNNAIPTAAAAYVAKGIGAKLGLGIYKTTGPKRSQQSGLDRVFSRPNFAGEAKARARYVIVDDTLTQGGTIAALAEHLQSQGTEVVSVVALAGKNYSTQLELGDDTLAQLRV